MAIRNLVIIFGDQLNTNSVALKDFDKSQDQIWMAEVDSEATHVWCHQIRLVFFFSCMRHFSQSLQKSGYQVNYHELKPGAKSKSTFNKLLTKDLKRLQPETIVIVQPGDVRVENEIRSLAKSHSIPLDVLNDDHFLVSPEEFKEWADGKKTLVLEYFYRWMRKRHSILMDNGKPVGGAWNFDQDNRVTFGKEGPPEFQGYRSFKQDKITKQVIKMVKTRFADHPGDAATFDYPVTQQQAWNAFEDFVENRLANFGQFQDAMWTDEGVLFHSRISAVMNVKLIDPRQVIDRVFIAYIQKQAPLNSIEGFIRQVIGWREFIRGVYFQNMPDYANLNELDCDDTDVPASFWDGETRMNCVREAMKSVMSQAYGHHIHRLMVLGLFAQLAGVHPKKFHDWHMAMYADAIDWVSLPNTLGMSQFGDGGVVGTKPYCASGNYINKMSNYCKGCTFKFKESTGENACPVTTLYWDFLDRHHAKFKSNRRMVFQIKNLEKKSEEGLVAIREQAQQVRQTLSDGGRL